MPLKPGSSTSRIKQVVWLASSDSRKSSAEANLATAKPSARTRVAADSRASGSSSTIAIRASSQAWFNCRTTCPARPGATASYAPSRALPPPILRFSGCLPLRADAQQIGHPDKIGHRTCAQLLHGVVPMHLHGDFADAELGSRLLVHPSRRHQRNDLPFARGERLEARAQIDNLLFTPAPFTVAVERDPDRIEQVLLANRLCQELG